jgi:hypothetical protein
MSGEALEPEGKLAESIIEVWRTRLSDISWFMKCLNEHLARRANAEDQCTGKFWEGRFKSRALLDEAGLLTAMTYVDLNPIRAGIAATPEESDFTSIHQRICDLRRLQEEKEAEDAAAEVKIHLRAFSSADVPLSTIPYRFDDYLDLVDWTGRTIRSDKRGSIDERLPPIVQRLNINPDAWHRSMQRHGNVFGRAMGRLDHLRLHASTLGQSWVRGLWRSEALFHR